MAVEGVGRTDRQLHMALEGVGRTDRQPHMALEGAGRTATLHLVVKGGEGTDIHNVILFILTMG